jgi:hypothetical protein
MRSLLGNQDIPYVATDHEISHGCDITWTLRAKQAPEHIITETWIGTSWIIEVVARGIRDGKPFHATHLYRSFRHTSRCDTSLGTTPDVLLQLVRNRWSMEGWHRIRRHPAPRGRPPLPGQWRRRDGHAAHRRLEPAAPGRVPADPGWHPGGDARHQGAAGNGGATTGTEP